MVKAKKEVVQDEVSPEAVVEESTAKETPVVVDAAADAKKAVVYDDEVAAIKDSRKRDLPLFRVTNENNVVWNLLHDAAGFLGTDTELYQRVTDALDEEATFVVAVSEHQAKLAILDRAYPMQKCSKKDRDYRYLHLLESAAKDAETTK